jgi:hypothetical protein
MVDIDLEPIIGAREAFVCDKVTQPGGIADLPGPTP